MNFHIETLNQWGGGFLNFAWPMLWQSSLLMALVFVLDWLLARKLRASVRYALWLTVLVKLLLPPTLAMPTGAGWWLFRQPAIIAPVAKFTVIHEDVPPPAQFIPHSFPPAVKPELDGAAYALLAFMAIGAALFVCLLVRWWQLYYKIRHALLAAEFTVALDNALRASGVRSRVTIKIVDGYLSPAVCGLIKPVILLPRILIEKLAAEQLHAVLLHELFHHRRKDVWVNCAQTFLQIFYWWHPLLWLANARIRRVREEAVDDAVMLALRDEPDLYAPTLLEVAKLASYRPRLSVGLVGIMESRSALGQRIERLVNFRAPRTAGLTTLSILGTVAFIAVTVPMGGAPAPETNLTPPGSDAADDSVRVFKIERPVETNSLDKILVDAGVNSPPTVYFYEDSGNLIARGSAQQLDLVERTVWKLNGYSPGPVKKMPPSGSTTSVGSEKNADTNLSMRVFYVDRLIFPAALRNISGINSKDTSMVAKSLFGQLGVNWDFPKGKSVAYNDQEENLFFVKATEPDLDIIERVLEALNDPGPEVHIKARFIEAPVGSMSWGTNDPNNVSWVMDDEYAKTMLKKLESSPEVEMLAEPDALAYSSRQVQMRATDNECVITNFAFSEISNKASIFPQTTIIQAGPILDMLPYVLADGHTIILRAKASVTKFLGYGQTNPAVIFTKAGKKIELPQVKYDLCIREASKDLNLFDGQTALLRLDKHFFSNGIEVDNSPIKSLADSVDKDVLVFITVTLVDSDGNRIHPNDESYYKYPAPDPILSVY